MKSATSFEIGNQDNLQVLGLDESASWSDIERAHKSLVSDLTPGPDADHQNVGLALTMLNDVNRAFALLRIRMVA
jgi:hypothetical protein